MSTEELYYRLAEIKTDFIIVTAIVFFLGVTMGAVFGYISGRLTKH